MSEKEFQKKIGGLFSKEYVLYTKSATTALYLALRINDVRGKKVIVPSNICFVVPAMIILSGNEPHFMDIDFESQSLDPKILNQVDDSEASAVILPHMYGQLAHIEEIVKISNDKNWLLIEDVAQSLGCKGEMGFAGSFSNYSVTSFGIGKIIDLGIGGCLCLNSEEDYYKAKTLYEELPIWNNELEIKYTQIIADYIKALDSGELVNKELLTSNKGALICREVDPDFSRLSKSLDGLGENIQGRILNVGQFRSILRHEFLDLPEHTDGSVYWRLNAMCNKNRDELLVFLKSNGVKVSKYFPSIQRLFCSEPKLETPIATKFEEKVVNFWVAKETVESDIEKINDLVHRFYEEQGK